MEASLKLEDNVWVVRNLAALLSILKDETFVAIEELEKLDFTAGPLVLTVTPHPQPELGSTIACVSAATYMRTRQGQIQQVADFVRGPTFDPRQSVGQRLANVLGLPCATNVVVMEDTIQLGAWFRWFMRDGEFCYELNNEMICNGFQFEILKATNQLIIISENRVKQNFFNATAMQALCPEDTWTRLDFSKNKTERIFYVNGVTTPNS